jgi:type II secretory pathway pseudopilin PulG
MEGRAQGLDEEKRRGRGFRGCLVVSWILAVIFIILALLAVPDFLKFQSSTKSFEPKTNHDAIFKAQLAYFGVNDTYAGREKCLEDLAWSPEGDCLYSYYCGDAVSASNEKPGNNVEPVDQRADKEDNNREGQ